ncbi:MAG: YqgE/AlgH family protein [Bacteroidota bacterium]
MITSSYRPLPGRFLISEPFMEDANFQRTVVLLVEHGDEGSLGFVLNRPLKVKIHEVVEEMPQIDSPVCLGGPVEQSMLQFVHKLEHLKNSRPISEKVFWGGDFEELQELIQTNQVNPEEILFFIGYSGWAPGQLQHELDRKSWIIAPENDDAIFSSYPKSLWKDLLKNMGDKYKIISNYPVDPSLN